MGTRSQPRDAHGRWRRIAGKFATRSITTLFGSRHDVSKREHDTAKSRENVRLKRNALAMLQQRRRRARG